MYSGLVLAFMVVVVASRPWRSDDEEWFNASALLEAVLVAMLLFTIA